MAYTMKDDDDDDDDDKISHFHYDVQSLLQTWR
jgi:hypothetical protein